MKTKANILLIVTAIILLFAACENKATKAEKDNEYVNKWIYSQMRTYYLWNKKLPNIQNLDFKNDSDPFFKGLLYRKDENGKDADRFSWIEPDYMGLINSLNGLTNDIGFDFIPLWINEQKSQIGFQILYTKPNTSATSKLKRGEIVTKVNNVPIIESNYRNILDGRATNYRLEVFNAETNSFRTEEIMTHANYAENPIYLHKIINKGEKKIGYLVYNFFAPNAGENDAPSRYDIELMNVLFSFKDAGITDCVLDLRYNTGGSIESSLNLASAFVPNRGVNKIFMKSEYNDVLTNDIIANNKQEMFSEIFRIAFSAGGSNYQIPELNISKLYILATDYTASASELIINGLRPYMEVKIIGQKTYGKNVGSLTLYKEGDRRNKWGLQPIVIKSYNSKDESEYTNGFDPQITVYERNYDFKPLGDENEIMLAVAIADITDSPLPQLKSSSNLKFIEKGASISRKKGAYEMMISNEKIEKLQFKINRDNSLE